MPAAGKILFICLGNVKQNVELWDIEEIDIDGKGQLKI
jgi:hypothetical protein